MNALRQFVRQVAAAQTATPDAETIVVKRLPAVEAAKHIATVALRVKPKRGRPITKTDRKAVQTRERVRLHRERRKKGSLPVREADATR